ARANISGVRSGASPSRTEVASVVRLMRRRSVLCSYLLQLRVLRLSQCANLLPVQDLGAAVARIPTVATRPGSAGPWRPPISGAGMRAKTRAVLPGDSRSVGFA